MEYDHSEVLDREKLLGAIREAEKACGEEQLTLQRFIALTKIPYHEIRRIFRKWRTAMKTAGCRIPTSHPPLETRDLLGDWANIVRKLGRAPGHREYWRMGRHHPTTVASRCGRWNKLPDYFRKFAEGKEEWQDVLALLPPAGYRGPACRYGRTAVTPRAPIRTGERIYGPPVDFKNIRHAPVNEMGVVHLFGAMSEELGFLIESIQSGFPDCEAKRCGGEGKWQLKRIEFEYESRNFRDHGHSAEGCDMIVCWIHNWPECPKNLEVIELSAEIKRLARTEQNLSQVPPVGAA